MRWTHAGFFCLPAILLILAHSAAAQDNSPYSRYGLGDLSNSQHITNRGMGGVSQAYNDPQAINFINPASYSGLLLTTFDIAIEGGVRTIADQDRRFRSGIGSLSYIQLGVPIRKKWGAVVGLRPVTRVSYNVSQNGEKTFFDTLKMPVLYQYEGNGGLYQLYVGTGVGLGNFSIGINAGYLFGNIENSTKAIYPPSQFVFPSRRSLRTSYSSFFYNAGLQYRFNLGNEVDLTLGLTGSMKQTLKARRGLMDETLQFDATSNEYVTQDTAFYEKGDRGNIIFPQQLGGGIMIRKTDSWMIGADYTSGRWDQYRNYGVTDSVGNSWKMSLGGQFIPNASAMKGYWNKVSYRAGAYYGRDYMFLMGERLPVYGFSIGAGLPIRRQSYSTQFTVINTAFEIGQRGSKESPLRETTYRVVLGFTLSDRWFVKRKYD